MLVPLVAAQVVPLIVAQGRMLFVIADQPELVTFGLLVPPPSVPPGVLCWFCWLRFNSGRFCLFRGRLAALRARFGIGRGSFARHR